MENATTRIVNYNSFRSLKLLHDTNESLLQTRKIMAETRQLIAAARQNILELKYFIFCAVDYLQGPQVSQPTIINAPLKEEHSSLAKVIYLTNYKQFENQTNKG